MVEILRAGFSFSALNKGSQMPVEMKRWGHSVMYHNSVRIGIIQGFETIQIIFLSGIAQKLEFLSLYILPSSQGIQTTLPRFLIHTPPSGANF